MKDDVPATQAVDFFARIVKKEAAVEAVYWRNDGDLLRAWSVLDDYNRQVEDRVYQAEAETLDQYPDVRLSFRVLYRHGRKLTDVRPSD